MKAIFSMFIKINGDELTPVNSFYKLKGRYKFLAKEESRYSYMGSSPYILLSSRGENIIITKEKKVRF